MKPDTQAAGQTVPLHSMVRRIPNDKADSVPLRSQELEVAGKLVELSLELVRLIRAEPNATDEARSKTKGEL